MTARTRVKVCGLTTPEAAAEASRLGADAIGLVLTDSPRRVSLEAARAIAGAAGAYVTTVGVLRAGSAAEAEAALTVAGLDRVQLDAGSALALPPVLRARAMPVVRVGTEGWEASAAACVAGFAAVLMEGPVSGAGVAVDWSLVAPWASRCRLVLAGGLSPANVGGAISRVRPWGVDVSSGVERAPGVKEPTLVAAFIRAAALADEGASR